MSRVKKRLPGSASRLRQSEIGRIKFPYDNALFVVFLNVLYEPKSRHPALSAAEEILFVASENLQAFNDNAS
jgi:hypothetical protein